MREGAQREVRDVDGETPVNPYSLLEAVNDASDTVNTGWLIFLAVMAYILIAIAGVTHRDLLLETPVALPIMQVSIQLKQFFTFAPILLVLFHLGIVAQLVLLARKTIEFDRAVRLLERTDKRTHPLRLELHNFFFVQAIAGPHRSKVMSGFLHGMSWLTTVIIPVLLLLFIQVAFLPYHDVTTTWVHRLALMFDLGLLLMIGTFLLQTETSFVSALVSNTRAHPLNVSATTLLFLLVGFISFFVATVPGERLDKSAQILFGAPKAAPAPGVDRNQVAGGFMPLFASGTDGSLFGFFKRNLVVTDSDLVVDKNVTASERSLKLRGRDLRYAHLDRSDLHQADLAGADLTEASLSGADLRGLWLGCVDDERMRLNGDRDAAGCASARNADFSYARIEGAHLHGTDLRSANFASAALAGADLANVMLSGANFYNANLDKADMSGGIHAEGANFLSASLQGADLNGAYLQAADVRSAKLQGAILSYAHLESAKITNAELEGASLYKAMLHGADLTGANIKAADFHGASVWLTAPPADDASGLADFGELQTSPLGENDNGTFLQTLDRLQGEHALSYVKDAFEPLMAAKDSAAWGAGQQILQWKTLGNGVATPEDSWRSRFTDHLIGMMCRSAGLATGVLRRAQSQHFRGDMLAIFERSKRDDCPAIKGVPEDVLRKLSTTLETARSN